MASHNPQSSLPDVEELLNMAIRSARSGNREGARLMFRQVLQRDKSNERAIMWMAKLARSQPERQGWLRRALETNPNNAVARSALEELETRHTTQERYTLRFLGIVLGVLVIVAVVAGIVAIVLGR